MRSRPSRSAGRAAFQIASAWVHWRALRTGDPHHLSAARKAAGRRRAARSTSMPHGTAERETMARPGVAVALQWAAHAGHTQRPVTAAVGRQRPPPPHDVISTIRRRTRVADGSTALPSVSITDELHVTDHTATFVPSGVVRSNDDGVIAASYFVGRNERPPCRRPTRARRSVPTKGVGIRFSAHPERLHDAQQR